MTFIQDNINECQTAIVNMEEFKVETNYFLVFAFLADVWDDGKTIDWFISEVEFTLFSVLKYVWHIDTLYHNVVSILSIIYYYRLLLLYFYLKSNEMFQCFIALGRL